MKSLTAFGLIPVCLAMQTHFAMADYLVGIPHRCNPKLLRAEAEGTTRVSFVVTTEGSVQSPVVADSSGDKDIDTASLKCVTHWRYKPAQQSGQPIVVPWIADIAWNPRRPPAITQLLRDCAKTVSARYPNALDTEGTTNFAVRYENYKVTAVSITRAGGVKEVDDAEATCMASTTPALREVVIVNNRVDYSQANTYDVAIAWNKMQDDVAK